MKKLLLLISLFLSQLMFTLTLNAQDYMDLLLLFVDEKYDICYHKAIKYTTKDKTKADALPYLYVAMASLEMSQDHKYTNMYPKAYKTSISYIGKYRKKDKEFEYQQDAEEFIERIKFIIAEDIENLMEEKTESSFMKAASFTNKICKMDPKDNGAKLLYAYLCYVTKNKSTGKELYKTSMEYIHNIQDDKFAFSNMTESQQYFLRLGIMEYANYKRKKPSAAMPVIELGKKFFYIDRNDCLLEDNSDFKALYDELDAL